MIFITSSEMVSPPRFNIGTPFALAWINIYAAFSEGINMNASNLMSNLKKRYFVFGLLALWLLLSALG